MRFHDVFDDGQAQTGSPEFFRTSFVHPEEPFKNTSLGLFGNTDPGILDRYCQTFRLLICGKNDLAFRLIEFDRIGNEIDEDLMDLVFVAG